MVRQLCSLFGQPLSFLVCSNVVILWLLLTLFPSLLLSLILTQTSMSTQKQKAEQRRRLLGNALLKEPQILFTVLKKKQWRGYYKETITSKIFPITQDLAAMYNDVYSFSDDDEKKMGNTIRRYSDMLIKDGCLPTLSPDSNSLVAVISSTAATTTNRSTTAVTGLSSPTAGLKLLLGFPPNQRATMSDGFFAAVASKNNVVAAEHNEETARIVASCNDNQATSKEKLRSIESLSLSSLMYRYFWSTA